MYYLIIIIFGLIIGSFLNVCIYRIPLGGSIMSPSRSYCPKCNHQLSVLDNIPVFSYIFLRGKCRYCKVGISPRYMIVELLTAGIFAFILYKGMSLHQSQYNVAMYILKACIFSSFLIVISFIDIDYEEIPDKIVFPGLAIGLLLMGYMSIMNKDIKIIAFSVLGAVAGALLIILIAILGKAVFRKEAMGGGDITLMAMIGMYVGLWPSIPLTIILASILGSIVGMILIAFRKKDSDGHIPFGPFLSMGALITMLYGNELWLFYKHLVGI
jgi:leader peptidase (prepilin peptidase) / N-methyltransferase